MKLKLWECFYKTGIQLTGGSQYIWEVVFWKLSKYQYYGSISAVSLALNPDPGGEGMKG